MTQILDFPSKNNAHHIEFDMFGDKVSLDTKEPILTGEKAIAMLERAKFIMLAKMEGLIT